MKPLVAAGRLSAWALTAVWGYLVSAAFYGSRIAGIRIGGLVWLCAVALGGAVSAALTRWLSEQRRGDLFAFCLSVLLAFLTVDTAYAVLINSHERGPSRADELLSDPHLWHGEIVPRLFYPTDMWYQFYKPNVRLEGSTYGEYYERRMLESPTLAGHVLHLKHFVYTIDANGLRNRIPVDESRVWGLGDSFAFGWRTTEGQTWSDRFGELIGQPVYNLGVSGTGPAQEVRVLEHLLRSGKARPTELLWMLFEGNDLENPYEDRRPISRGGLFDHTLVGEFLSLPSIIHGQSVVGRVLDGELRFTWPGEAHGNDPYKIDGVSLSTPIYHSERWGYCMFNPDDIRAVTRGEGYVEHHPNRPRLDQTFERVKSLSAEYGFKVSVMVAPTLPRLYGHDFPELPQPSTVPYFIRYIEGLARRSGFETIDLLGALSAKDWGGMLYDCDDHHWNDRGNEVVARILAKRFRNPDEAALERQ